MDARNPAGNDGDWMNRTPEEVIESIIKRGEAEHAGLNPHLDALAYARRQGWKRLAFEQYAKLGDRLERHEGEIDAEGARRLYREIARTSTTDDTELVLRVLLGTLVHLSADSPLLGDFIRAFEVRLEEPATAWKTRLAAGEFLRRLERVDPALADAQRRRLTARLVEWVLDYCTDGREEEFDLRSRAVFAALAAVAWSDRRAENVENGLDGAFFCAVETLMEGGRFAWFKPFVMDLSEELSPRRMYRRLSAETLYGITEMFAQARGRLSGRHPDAALAVTALEASVHRPHRLQLERLPLKLELELPGARGFGAGARFKLYDISADGCLAVALGPVAFEETAPGENFQLDRGGRACPARRLSGVIRQERGSVAVRPGTELLLHDASTEDREWAAIDGASVVRVSFDEKNNRAWFGFHFERVVPAVQRELDRLVYGVA